MESTDPYPSGRGDTRAPCRADRTHLSPRTTLCYDARVTVVHVQECEEAPAHNVVWTRWLVMVFAHL
jgi:hypothetical protein